MKTILIRSEDHAEAVLARAVPADPESLPERCQGGDFTVVEAGGGVAAVASGGSA